VTKAGSADPEAAIRAAADAVAKRLGPRRPRVAIVLGSGLGFLADEVGDAVRIPYADIPGFPQPGVAGHKGELVAGTLAGVSVLVQSGRFHLYEGHAPATTGLPVRVFAQLGVRTLIATNAAGGVRQDLRPPALMLITDHINLSGKNPLVGAALAGEQRFPDMSAAYDPELHALAQAAARELAIPLAEGVYCALLGPSYETPAEIRMLQRLGVDAVGMSTVPEVIVARACGMRCVALSIITNAAAGLGAPLDHAEVLEMGARVAGQLGSLIKALVRRLPAVS
jgi:purine-nucleoside phosphorylase